MNTVLHADMDAFFASVEQRCNPALRGKPVLVGGRPEERSVVAAASYEAKQFHIKAGMPLFQAKLRCPQAVVVEGNPAKYLHFSERIKAILLSFTPYLEPFSVDESFLGLPGMTTAEGMVVGRQIKIAVRSALGLNISIGVAGNKLLAKLASDLSKPDGLLEIPPERALEILWPLAVGELWGVGERTQEKLEHMGIRTVGELAQVPVTTLRDIFGIAGEGLYLMARGSGSAEVSLYPYQEEPQSLGHEKTLDADTRDPEVIARMLNYLADRVAFRLRQDGYRSRLITVKRRTSDFKTISHRRMLADYTDDDQQVLQAAKHAWLEFPPTELGVRAVGITAEHLLARELTEQQSTLFAEWRQQEQDLGHAIDRIRGRFGWDFIRRAKQLEEIPLLVREFKRKSAAKREVQQTLFPRKFELL